MQAKKSLGQHFLKSQKAIETMVKTSGAQTGDLVLEIGPGMGVLTEALLQAGASVVAVEKDDLLIPVLEEKFEKEIKSGQLKLIHDDILNFDVSKVPFGGSELPRGTLDTYKLVANIPYYITGQIIRIFLEAENQPESMTLLVQKEVAERIVARDEKESLLSLSVKAYGTPKYVEKVPRGAFAPAPNVDSAIIHISNISKNNFRKNGSCEKCEKEFFELIHAGFAHKRKMLLPNLSSLYAKDALSRAFAECKLDVKCRAEDVPLQKWFELLRELFSQEEIIER